MKLYTFRKYEIKSPFTTPESKINETNYKKYIPEEN